ncbi:MAG: class I SAM-dependent methyltransferase [Burkholderiaceae bacterium]
MSRLDSFILRMQAQRACIDEVAAQTAGQDGLILELGLGNGRTYDHLRQRFPGRSVYVFDREVAAHPDCIPPTAMLRLGDFRQTIPAFLKLHRGTARFVNADVGSADKAASVRLANDLAPALRAILAPRAWLACDQPVDCPGLERLPLPRGDFGDHYCLYRRAA